MAAPRVLVTGGSGFIGRHLVEHLRACKYDVVAPTRSELDLEARDAAARIVRLRPDAIFHLAAFFGGVHFVRGQGAAIAARNSAINAAVVAAHDSLRTARLIAAGSACMYPGDIVVPAVEGEVLDGPLHETVRAFGETKRALFRYVLEHGETAAIFTTVYGPGDHVEDPKRAHFLGGLLSRFEAARRRGDSSMTVWGSGEPVRDAIYVVDAVSALVFLFLQGARGAYNVASGDMPMSIAQYAQAVRIAVGYEGDVRFDTSWPDGQRYKALDTRKIRARGWRPTTTLEEGLHNTLAWMKRRAA